jgi:large conductance mechanosensitive channel
VVVKSLVDDILMPPLGLALGRVDLTNRYALLAPGPKAPPPYASLADARAAGAVTLNYGQFINNVLAFLIVALAVFLLVRAATRRYRKPVPPAPNTRPCPFCATTIPLLATRCPNCTSQLASSTP